MSSKIGNTLGVAIGAAFIGSLSLSQLAAASPAFQASDLATGYMLAAAGEGKCGEGKCGASKAKVTQAEGKCGEGKCGDASFTRTDSDHDGKVSRDEFLAVARDRAGDFDRIDADHDGFISEAEAYQHLKNVFESNGKPMPAGLFARFQGDRH